MGEDEPRTTANDIVELNRSAISTTAKAVRQAGTVLVALALAGLAAWLWIVARQQQLFGNEGPSGFISLSNGMAFKERIDLFAGSIGFLLNVGLVGGVGLGIRLAAENVMLRAGASLTGLEVGDPMAAACEDDGGGDGDNP